MMENSNFYCWQKWLTYANFKAIFGGLIVAFTGNSFLLHPHNQYTELVFFADEGFSDHTITFKVWLFSIIGGSIVGFHILMGMISENAFKKKERGGTRPCGTGYSPGL